MNKPCYNGSHCLHEYSKMIGLKRKRRLCRAKQTDKADFKQVKQISKVRENYGKTRTFQIYEVLNISGKTETHTISKTWEKLLPIIREEHGKKQTF